MTLSFDVKTVLTRHLIKMARNRTLLATNLFSPLLILFFLSQLLQKLSSFPGLFSGSYLAYLTPGVIVMTGFTGSTQSGISIVNDLNSGFFQKMLQTPVRRPAILLGRLLADVLIITAGSVIVLVVALLMGVTIDTGLPGVLLIFSTTAFFGLALSGFFLALGIRTRKPETLSAVASTLTLLLFFMSTAIFPKAFMPSWAQTFSDLNPMSYASDVARSLIQGGLTWNTILSAYVFIGVLAALTFAAALYQFRRVVS